MERLTESSAGQFGSAADLSENKQAVKTIASQPFALQPAAAPPCPTCAGSEGSQVRSFVYALGEIKPLVLSPAVEREIAQAVGRSDTSGLTDRHALHSLLSKREGRYLAWQICWVLTIQGLETYLLQPLDPMDLDLLLEATAPRDPIPWISLVIGWRGPVAPPERCNGLMLPVVTFVNLYSFDQGSLIQSIPKPNGATKEPKGESDEKFAASAGELFDKIMQMTGNAGATDEDRALNYLAVRYPAIYLKASELLERNCSLTAVDFRRSAISTTRRIVEVIFSFTNRNTDVTDKFFVRVDVTEEFPFLVTKLSAYYDR